MTLLRSWPRTTRALPAQYGQLMSQGDEFEFQGEATTNPEREQAIDGGQKRESARGGRAGDADQPAREADRDRCQGRARHAGYAVFQMAEVAVPRELLEKTLRLIDGLRRRPAPAQDRTNASSPREECVRMTRERAKSMNQRSFWGRAWRKRWWKLCRPLTVSSKPGRMLAFAPSLGSICGMSAK